MEQQSPSPVTPEVSNRTGSADSVNRLRQDLAGFATKVRNGEFGPDGLGSAGTAFRDLQRSGGEEAETIWASLLEVGAEMWDAGHEDESVAMLEIAMKEASPPTAYADRARKTLQSGRDSLCLRQIEKLFDVGDVEGARKAAEALPNDMQADVLQRIQEQSQTRIRSRKLAFLAGGVAIAALLAAGAFAFIKASDRISMASDIELPTIPEENPVADLFNRATINSSASRVEIPSGQDSGPAAPGTAPTDPASPTLTDPPTPAPIPAPDKPEPIVPPKPIEAPSTEIQQPGDAAAETQEGSSSGGDPNPDAAIEPEEQAAEAPQQAETPAPRPDPNSMGGNDEEVSQVALLNCALGQAVAMRGIDMVMQEGRESAAASVDEFATTVNKACATLDVPQEDVTMVRDAIPQERIDAIANNLFSN